MKLNIFEKAILPSLEIGCYESLWLNKEITTFKRMADKFYHSGRNLVLPSDLVSEPSEAIQYYYQILEMLKLEDLQKYFGAVFRGAVDYPQKLNNAKSPVEILYYLGDLGLLYGRSVSIVGTRHPTAAGIKRAEKLTKAFVERKFITVSGLAKGIDTCVHRTTLDVGGHTIAVLGTPLNVIYPKENRTLFKEIVNNHLAISQVPFIRYSTETQATTRFYFPERNKTMSALTDATVIVEAGDTSGTLIQARSALEQGRKLFILASCFEQGLAWPDKYLAKGAIKVHDFDDIWHYLQHI